jgi:hypothetical protein
VPCAHHIPYAAAFMARMAHARKKIEHPDDSARATVRTAHPTG